jgi:hypothetical protein
MRGREGKSPGDDMNFAGFPQMGGAGVIVPSRIHESVAAVTTGGRGTASSSEVSEPEGADGNADDRGALSAGASIRRFLDSASLAFSSRCLSTVCAQADKTMQSDAETLNWPAYFDKLIHESGFRFIGLHSIVFSRARDNGSHAGKHARVKGFSHDMWFHSYGSGNCNQFMCDLVA